MSSSQLVLAYSFCQPQPRDQLEIRARHASSHLSGLFRAELRMVAAGDGRSGLIAWTPTDTAVGWKAVVTDDSRATVWLHVPSAAGLRESWATEDGLADQLLGGGLRAGDLAAPFGLLRWSAGQLDIANDVLGLVRLFQMEFDNARIWTTRPGLAHVFMGVEPTTNDLAWTGMASVGWALNGMTQLGHGRQLPPASRITVTADGTRTSIGDGFAQWFTDARRTVVTPDDNVRDMRALLHTSRFWRDEPVADLSGGKDSRAVAAVGLTSGAVRHVRTVATDHGEVDTAQRLVALVGGSVRHTIIRPAGSRTVPATAFLERLLARHRAWEGRYLATSAFNAPLFTGFRTEQSARLNGLGGEFVAGAFFASGHWSERLSGAGPQKALDRLAATAGGGLGVSDDAVAATIAGLQWLVPFASDIEAPSALAVLDLCYMLERMPYWSNTYATGSTLAPLLAASLLTVGAQHVGAAAPDGQVHLSIIRAAIPSWAEVPFYKPTRAGRAVPFIWETTEWAAVKSYLGKRLDRSMHHDPDAVRDALRAGDDLTGGKKQEFLFHRLLWELTFLEYVEELRRDAAGTARELTR